MQAGRLKVLAITASEPSKVVPDIPTVIQAGFPGLTFDGLVGFYGTRDMPAALREQIAADVEDAWRIPRSSAGCRRPARRWFRAPPRNSQPRSTGSARGLRKPPRCWASRRPRSSGTGGNGRGCGLPLSGRPAYKADELRRYGGFACAIKALNRRAW